MTQTPQLSETNHEAGGEIVSRLLAERSVLPFKVVQLVAHLGPGEQTCYEDLSNEWEEDYGGCACLHLSFDRFVNVVLSICDLQCKGDVHIGLPLMRVWFCTLSSIDTIKTWRMYVFTCMYSGNNEKVKMLFITSVIETSI